MGNEYEDMKKDIHGPIEMDMKEALKKRRDFYLNELIFFKEYEENLNKRMKESMSKPRFRKKENTFLLSIGMWIHLLHEMELLYTILYQLVEHLEKEIGNFEKLKIAKERIERFEPILDEIDRQFEKHKDELDELKKSGIYG